MGRVVRDYAVEGLASDAEVLPVLVTKDDEPLKLALPDELPAVTLRTFKEILEAGSGDTRELYELVRAHWDRAPAGTYKESHSSVVFGPYTFEVPIAEAATAEGD